jgi:phosphoribosylanthranilate isomerase
MRVKICGITQPAQGRAIAQLGATALGFICVPQSPRYVTPEQIAQIIAALEDLTQLPDRVGVFANAEEAAIATTLDLAPLSALQLHGNESPEQCHQIHQRWPELELIKALRIRHTADLEQAQAYEAVVDTLLLDAYHPEQLGGTGLTLDWSAIAAFRPICPWLLAGGLTPDNIQLALNQASPDGIDLSSGVERSPGDKDLGQVAQLMQQLIKTGAEVLIPPPPVGP